LSADISIWGGDIQAVTLEDATVTLELAVLKDIQRRRRERAGTAAAPASEPSTTPARRLPIVHVSRAAISVRDEKGALLVATELTGELAEDKLQAQAGQLTLGSAPSEVVDVTAATVRGTLQGGTAKLTGLSAESAVLRWNSEGGGVAR